MIGNSPAPRMGIPLVCHAPWPVWQVRRQILISLRDRIRGIPEPHKLMQAGATPAPATTLSRLRNVGGASVLTGLQCASPHNMGSAIYSSLGSVLSASGPLPARFFLRNRVGFLPVLIRLFAYQRNRRAHRLAFFLGFSPQLQRVE